MCYAIFGDETYFLDTGRLRFSVDHFKGCQGQGFDEKVLVYVVLMGCLLFCLLVIGWCHSHIVAELWSVLQCKVGFVR